MSILLFPFKILSYVFSGLGSVFGLLIAAICNAIIARILIGVYAGCTGNIFIQQSTITWIMIGAFVLTLIAAHEK